MTPRLRNTGPIGAAFAVMGTLMGGACSTADDAPIALARTYARALAAGDAAALVPLLTQDAQTELQALAETATNQVGGRRTFAPHEVMQLTPVSEPFQVSEISVHARDAHAATVRLQTPSGSTFDLNLVEENGTWKIQVPLPTLP